MNSSAVDIPAILLAVAISLAITAVVAFANRGENRRRTWIAGGAMTVVLVVLVSLCTQLQTRMSGTAKRPVRA